MNVFGLWSSLIFTNVRLSYVSESITLSDWARISDLPDSKQEEVINLMKQGYSYGTIAVRSGLTHEQVFEIIELYMVIMGHKKDY